MIIGFTKTMHTHIIGQPRKQSNAQQKRVNGFTYSFITTINQTDMDWDGVYYVILECLAESMKLNLDTIKDMEISLDIPSGQYSLRFTSTENLIENAYAAEVLWSVYHLGGEFSDTGLKKYPWDYINDSSLQIVVEAVALSLPEIEEILANDV